MSSIQERIEAVLASAEPDVEVLLAEVVGGDRVRLFIDHPDGVSLDLCERVTNHLAEIREQYALEVSSPGTERPLTKPEHFRRYLGRRARVRTRGDHDGAAASPASWWAPRTPRSPSPPTRAWFHPVRRDPPFQPREGLTMSQEIVDAVTRPRPREGHRRGEADDRARGRAAVGVQEAARLGAYARVRMDRDNGDFRVEELHRPRGPRGRAARRGRGGGLARRAAAASTPRPARSSIPEAPDIPLERARASTGTRSRRATSRRRTSAASPPRPPSRSSCSASARRSAT